MNNQAPGPKLIEFPDPRESTREGLVAIGGELQAPVLKAAYAKGIFPWPQPGLPMLWFSPDPRGILEFSSFHVPRSLQKWARQNPEIRVELNQNFRQVMESCQRQPRPGQDGTWIVPEMIPAYEEMFQSGNAYCLEAWREGTMIGGIYGVIGDAPNGKYVSGESMFHTETNASKFCLWKLVEHFQANGFHWMDIQMLTEVTEAMGGTYVPRNDFLTKLGV